MVKHIFVYKISWGRHGMVCYTLYMEGGENFQEDKPNCTHPDEFYVLDMSKGREPGIKLKAQTLPALADEIHKTNGGLAIILDSGDVITTIPATRVFHSSTVRRVTDEDLLYFRTLLAEPNYMFGGKKPSKK